MNWFYAKDGQQAGPVDDAELDRLVTTGDIADSTLVWHGGLPNWQPYAAVHAGAGVAGVSSTLAPVATGAGRVAPGQAQCSQCGRVLPADEVVRIDNLDVCAECKPGFVQRLREGAVVGGSLRYAGFGIRLGAAVLDGLILIPVFALYVGALLTYLMPRAAQLQQDQSAAIAFQIFNAGLALALQVFLSLYSAFCVNRFGGTPGKRICKLRIVKGDGSKVFFGRAWGRYLAKIISRIFFIGYFFIFFDDQKRALHDMICDTRVIHDAE